jgi:hypothetical protein
MTIPGRVGNKRLTGAPWVTDVISLIEEPLL